MSQAPPMPPPAVPAVTAPPEEQGTSRLEIVAGILLGIAAVVAAFAAYQGSLADGNSLQGYTESTQHLSDANFFYSASAQQYGRDLQLFLAYAQAANTPGQEGIAVYIQETLMDDNMAAAVEWWEVTEDAVTPFDVDPANPYRDENGAFADLEQEAAAVSFQAGSDANGVGDQYSLAGVILAIALFFGGIATLMRSSRLGWTLMGISGLSLLTGVVLVLGAAA